jgi:hypothetical protein
MQFWLKSDPPVQENLHLLHPNPHDHQEILSLLLSNILNQQKLMDQGNVLLS